MPLLTSKGMITWSLGSLAKWPLSRVGVKGWLKALPVLSAGRRQDHRR